MKASTKLIPIMGMCIALIGCSSSGSDSGTADTGNTAGTVDAGTGDAGAGDAGTGDAGTGDAGAGDAGAGDAGTGDAGTGDSGNGNSPNMALVGLWDFSEDGDIQYQEFSADGTITNWDYDCDIWGDGENCYIKGGPFAFTPLGNNQFEGFGGEVVTIVVNGNQMTVTDIDGTFVYPRLTGLSTTDFNICS